MFNSRLTSLIRKEFIQIQRDRRTLILVLIIPVMQLFLLGYAATNDVRNIALAVFDQDNSASSRKLLAAFRGKGQQTKQDEGRRPSGKSGVSGLALQ